MDPATARLLMGAQEDLRREIARQMHDGPAQSLTNIVLQAQIVERLVRTDPERAAAKSASWWAWSSRRSTPPRRSSSTGRWCSTTSVSCRRYGARPAAGPPRQRASRIRVDGPGPAPADGPREWAVPDARRRAGRLPGRRTRFGHSQARLERPARRGHGCHSGDARARTAPRSRSPTRRPATRCRPPWLRSSEERRAAQQAAAEAAVRASVVIMPPPTWREIQDRAASVGVQAALLADGGRLYLVADLPMMDGAGAGTT